ncbi:hypothetical protein K2173_011110 [Erythroxylum novogranatense]|uniref:Uncharacterized protein n=1 Tax=Erythroxylum novogranatense TaxID=1862640 RepID=A0AAV8U4R0_9ROSI|nr:hypothetical protein K2173_011110 [Erythroxylum novogranatense]
MQLRRTPDSMDLPVRSAAPLLGSKRHRFARLLPVPADNVDSSADFGLIISAARSMRRQPQFTTFEI